MKTLYVTDLDGTLLDSENKVKPYSIGVINSLIESGVCFTYATARSLSSASLVTKDLALRSPVAIYNGVMIIDPNTEEVLSFSDFDEEFTRYASTVLLDYGVSPLVYSLIDGEQKVTWVSGKESDGMLHYLDSRRGDKRLRPLNGYNGLFDGSVFYYTCIGEKSALLPAYEEFAKDSRCRCILQQELYREEYWLEIMPANATKANSVQKLKELLECDSVVSFGDALNDIPMFEISDRCYAVENAADALKKLATQVIGSNEAEGVAKWLAANVM